MFGWQKDSSNHGRDSGLMRQPTKHSAYFICQWPKLFVFSDAVSSLVSIDIHELLCLVNYDKIYLKRENKKYLF